MNKSRAITNTVLAFAAAAALVVVTAGPASATTYSRSCGVNSVDIGVVSDGAYVDDRWHGDCGTVAVRARYNLPNGVTAYTAWVSASNFANVYIPAGSSIVSADARAGTYYYYGLLKR